MLKSQEHNQDASTDGQVSAGQVTRRGFMIGATTAGFTLAFVPTALLSTAPAQALADGKFEPTLWYNIDDQGIVTVHVTKAEMGQHVFPISLQLFGNDSC